MLNEIIQVSECAQDYSNCADTIATVDTENITPFTLTTRERERERRTDRQSEEGREEGWAGDKKDNRTDVAH